MPFDWGLFRAALLRDNPRAALHASIAQVERWVDAWPTDASEFRAATADIAPARAVYRTLWLVRARPMRPNGPDDGAQRMTELAARRARTAVDLTEALLRAHPDVAGAIPPPEREAAHAALLALGARADAAVAACGLGLATPERLAALAAVFDEFDVLAAHIPPGVADRANLEHSRAHVALALGGAAAFLGQRSDALGWYARADAAFTAAGDPTRAADARTRADVLRAASAADFDADASRALAAVVGGDADALDRAASLAALARQQCAAGDYFEAARTADQATRVLRDAGVADPDTVEFDVAAATLVAAAATRAGGSAFVARCTQGVTTWAGITQARAAAAGRDAASRQRADALLARVFAFGMELTARASAEALALDDVLAPYGLARMCERNAPEVAAEQGWAWQQAVSAFDARVQDALHACGALAPDMPCDALAATAAALEAVAGQPIALEAGAHEMPPLQRARTRLLTAGIRLQQGDRDGCRTALDDAVAFLTDTRTPRPESFADAGGRQLYLDAQWTRLKAAGVDDLPAALAVCIDTVAFVEAFRTGVSDPYQQSAFLASTIWAYDYSVGIARRLGAWDTMLGTMDAAKARGVLRRGPPADAATLTAAREIAADPDPSRRARRWSLASIARARAAATPPPPTLAAVQAALAIDEVVLDYYWVAADVLAIAAIDRDGLAVERVALDAAALERLAAYTALLAIGQTNRASGAFFTALGAQLLPAVCRARMQGKRRLVISPHRTLHLFPFHAADWNGAPLIETFAVRYVPNLAALLLPWRGPIGGPVLSIGCGTFVGADAPPALADAEPEAEEVASAYRACGRATTVLTGAGASRAGVGALAAALPGYSTIHLATHALSVLAPDAADDPLATRVYLHDGTLDGVSVAALGFRAEVVVLAACNSGQRAIAGRGLAQLPGDDVFGLQAVLFGSGVRCVLGALWPVASGPTRSIMGRLHTELAGGAPPDIALQAALRAHRAGPERWRHPVYWAPYYLVELGRVSSTES